MNKNISVTQIGAAILLMLAVALLATGILFRPKITIHRETSLVGSNNGAITLLDNDARLTEIQEAVKMSGKKVDEISFMGGSLLYWAADNKRLDVAEWLLTEGADPNGIHPAMPPLASAISKNDVAMVKLLVEFDADPDLDRGNGITPRKLAAVGGNAEIVEALSPPAKATEEAK